MFHSVKQFMEVLDAETKSTLACFAQITDESLSKDLVKDYRSIERTANHIADCIASIPAEAGLPVTGYEKQHYNTVASLTEAYRKNSEAVKAAVANWTDETLQENTPMYGEVWKKGFALWVTITHEIHHRGQLTVLMRIAGLKVPGVYGPAKEEWETMPFLPQAD